MNYSKAFEDSLKYSVHSIQSSAETELGRKLTSDELSILSAKFKIETVLNSINKVCHLDIFTNMKIFLFIFFLQYGFGAVRFLLLISSKLEFNCFFSPNPTPRDGNCLLHGKIFVVKHIIPNHHCSAIADGILHNEAFRHTRSDEKLENWTKLLQEFRFYGDMDTDEHIHFLRWRFVTGAMEWLSGSYGSKENDKQKLGYTDQEWEMIWTPMLENGAWAMPPLNDDDGHYLKENHAPEMLIKFVAHDLKSHIIVFDLQLERIQFCSGNHLRENNVIFESPLILYATGSHFQAVFQKDHASFIDLAKKLDDADISVSNSDSSNSSNEKKRFVSSDRSESKKNKNEDYKSSAVEPESFSKQGKLNSDTESRLEEIKRIKTKDRSKEVQREYEALMKKMKRSTSNQQTKIDEQKNIDEKAQETTRPIGAHIFQEGLPDHLRDKKPRNMTQEEKKEYNNLRRKASRKNESQDHSAERNNKQAIADAQRREKETPTEKKKRNETVAKNSALKRAKETETEKRKRNEAVAKNEALKRAKESEAEKKKRNEAETKKQALKRAKETEAEKRKRNEAVAKNEALKRANETEDKAKTRKEKEKQQRAIRRAKKIPTSQYNARNAQKVLVGAQIVPELRDTDDKIGAMDDICKFCGARKWPAETPSICCNSGKIELDPFPEPPLYLKELLTKDTVEGKLFRNHTRPLNNAITLSSLQVRKKKFDSDFAPNIIYDRRVCQRIGPLYPEAGEEPKFA